ncbi:MAG: hypothetical protein HC831_20355 [Chloroflexia bacterium]|nr:hypothetical protein [Chloroflexia bacterium]
MSVVGNQVVLASEVEEQYFQMQARGMYPRSDEKCRIFEDLLFQKMLIVQAAIDSVEVTENRLKLR